jgi:lipopolysaccharide transport system permease protein
MSAVSDKGVEPAALSLLLRRPTAASSVVLDLGFAVIAYFASYWLRFRDSQLPVFLPGAVSTVPFVVGGQILALLAVGAYARRQRLDWLLRVVSGVVMGTLVASVLLGITVGFEGVSRGAFAADVLLLTTTAIGWRSAWVVRTRSRARSSAAAGLKDAELVDRAEEMAPLAAVVASLYRYRELLKNLILKDLKLKYRGSVFGFLWSLANPLLMIVVYTVAFTFIMRIRTIEFVFYLMLGQLSWTFFASSANMSTSAIVDNGGLLKSVRFPRAILPIGTVFFNFAQFLLTLAVFLPAMLMWYAVPFSWAMLLFPVFLTLQVVFTIGVALILSTWTAFFRDVRHLLEVGLAMLFWLTPIVYEVRSIPERFRLLILISPMSSFVVAYEQIFFYREWPDLTVWVIAVMYALGAFVAGALTFLAFEPQLTEQL